MDQPQSSTRKRIVALSDREIIDDIAEERFRVGWPTLQPLPTEFQWNLEYVLKKKLEDLNSTFREILRAHGIQLGKTGIVIKRQMTQGSSHAGTAMIHIHAIDKAVGSWMDATARIVRAIEEVEKEHGEAIAVEIIDERIILNRLILPVKRDDTILETWSSAIAPSIMRVLDEKLWTSLSLVRMGVEGEEAKAELTVLVNACEAVDEDWRSTILPKLKDLVRPTAIQSVEIWQAQAMGENCTFHTEVLPEQVWKHSEPMWPTDSIGPEDDCVERGTLGGFLKLWDPTSEQETTNILTCFNTPEA